MLNKNQIEKLQQELDSEAVRKRPDSGMTYIEGYYVIKTANEIFGYDGWELTINDLKFQTTGKYGIFQALITVQVKAGDELITRSEVGFGIPAGESAQAYETAGKAAVTDGMKRAFRTFGSRFANDLYDKDNPLHGGARDKSAQSSSRSATAPEANNAVAPVQPKVTISMVKPEDKEPIFCEGKGCGKEIKGTAKHSVKDIVSYCRYKCGGHVLCYSCQQQYPECLGEEALAA